MHPPFSLPQRGAQPGCPGPWPLQPAGLRNPSRRWGTTQPADSSGLGSGTAAGETAKMTPETAHKRLTCSSHEGGGCVPWEPGGTHSSGGCRPGGAGWSDGDNWGPALWTGAGSRAGGAPTLRIELEPAHSVHPLHLHVWLWVGDRCRARWALGGGEPLSSQPRPGGNAVSGPACGLGKRAVGLTVP